VDVLSILFLCGVNALNGFLRLSNNLVILLWKFSTQEISYFQMHLDWL